MGKISKLVAKQFDTRFEAMLASYILDKGFDQISKITDTDIEELEGNGMMTQGFVQSLVRTARDICTQFSVMDILTWIRLECWFTPFPSEFRLYKEEMSGDMWRELAEEFDLYDEDGEMLDEAEFLMIRKGDED